MKIEKLPKIYQNLLYFKVWERKGSIRGIHEEFGKMSLFRRMEIPQNYHLSHEELVELLLDFIAGFDSFDNL